MARGAQNRTQYEIQEIWNDIYDPVTHTIGIDSLSDAWDSTNHLIKVKEQYAPGYEDNVNNVAKVEQRFSYKAVAAADIQVKASPGFLHTVTFSCNDAAPTAGSVIIYDNTAESGTQVFNHTFTTTPFVPFTVLLDYTMATGIYIGFTTTNDVNVSCSYR